MLTPIFRTVIIYILILVAFRIMGKRQISQLQTSELVATIILSELAVMPIQNQDQSLIWGIIPMVIIVLLEVLMAYLMMKSNTFRQLTCGKPIILIEKGKINQENLKRVKMSIEDLFEELRQKEAFYLDDVEYAIIETSGTLSVIKKASTSPLTPEQMKVNAPSKGIEVVVVSDGVVSHDSVALSGQTVEWIQDRIKQSGFSMKEVFIMTVSSKGKYRIIPKEI
ncbi:DUF421 domain-containing protein [Scatolibacter rhodanostii]|uniref:DUF421 domain-containing protein n=1 Tax=Scatolibacter rhodanostii TaxID=2014781 RepID=UPI001356337C|nr:DUF421 domain-containing protein [Scatolibacter rhodanostii]